LWLYTACGLLRIERSQVDAWIADPARRVEPTLWDATDGALPLVESSHFRPILAKAADGKLWFVTREDIQVVDPRHLADNKLPPPVHIEQIVSDNKMYWQNLPGAAASSVHLPARTRDVEIDYTALSLIAPEKTQFRVKLEGQDNAWRTPVNPRHSHYTNLPPGAYRFRVIACNNSGVWNEQGDSLEFSIAPAYYQTNWFLAFCAFFVLALLSGAYQLRVRQVRQEITIGLEAKIGERARIARDLHDTLLQSFHGLLYRFYAVRNLLPGRPEEAIQALDSALIRAEQAMDEGRQSIQELRSELSAENDFDQMLIAIGEELASTPDGKNSSPSFNVIVEGERRGLSPIVKEEVLRVAGELLQNAFRHAHARAIEAEIRYDKDVFRMIVRDDGKGIDPQVLKDGGRAGHWGMPGVHERAREIGARLEFWSEAGAGTEVRLTLPAARAYKKSRNGGWSRLFRKRRMHERES
jgi:signal transduction histidine kinase